jgi:hypothetical protein
MMRALIEKSWSRHFPTVLPEQVILNKNCVDYVWEEKDGEPTLVEVDVVAYLVPFTKAVEQFLSIPAVNKALLENFDRNQASFKNTQNKYKNHPVKLCIQIFWMAVWLSQTPYT